MNDWDNMLVSFLLPGLQLLIVKQHINTIPLLTSKTCLNIHPAIIYYILLKKVNLYDQL